MLEDVAFKCHVGNAQAHLPASQPASCGVMLSLTDLQLVTLHLLINIVLLLHAWQAYHVSISRAPLSMRIG